MPTYSAQHAVSYTPQQMFDLVADVERYPEFLPLCDSLVVRSREVVDGHDVLVATMGVGFKAVKEKFTTRVTLDRDAQSILVEYLDGPFHHLENRWRFVLPEGRPQNGASARGCVVDFYIDYEFKSAVLGILMGSFFDQAFRRFTQSFEDRAKVVYGPVNLDA